jgi:hypothetical protein
VDNVEYPDLGRTTRRLRTIVGLSTAAMLVMSWPLWVGAGDIPRVPFVASISQTTGPAAWALFGALLATVLLTALVERWRGWFAVSVALLAAVVLQDQHRFQPWAYQYAMTGFFLAGLPVGTGLRYARGWYVSIYVHSGLSKLDVSFCDELGLLFLAEALRPLGLDAAGWPILARRAAVLVMPLGEIATAWALVWPRLRPVGLAGATVLHLGLIVVLGPTGLGHSAIVLVWNAAMLAGVWVAFAPGPDLARGGPATSGGGWVAAVSAAAVRLAFWAGVIWPLGERWGVCDAWPAHALYPSHVERLTVDLHGSELGGYPGSIRAHLVPGAEGPWRRVDLTGWSRAVRGTPVYPQNRAGLGLAEGLAARYGGRGLVRVTLFGPADRWTGRRPRTELVGLGEVRRQGDRYRLNAHPAAVPGGDPFGAGDANPRRLGDTDERRP